MSFEVFISDRAERELGRIPNPARKRIQQAMLALEAEALPPAQHVKKLQGFADLYRRRVGDYRILYQVQGRRVTIARIVTRQDAY